MHRYLKKFSDIKISDLYSVGLDRDYSVVRPMC